MELTYGSNCKDNKTLLQSISLEELYEKLVSGEDHSLVSLTKNLRSVLKYSTERYRALKTTLPFFSCSVFEPALRSLQYFREAHGLVIDIDQHSPIEPALIEKFKLDPRIALGYISPSNMGIKLVFQFDKPVSDPEIYTGLYKRFSYSFASQYQLSDTIDQRNCDVSRISFICHDPGAWIQNEAMTVEVDEWSRELISSAALEEVSDHDGISSGAYRQILQLLETKPKVPKKIIPLMEEITVILPVLEEELAIYGIRLQPGEAIQYGAKLHVFKDQLQGELNIYWGKKGYNVVTSPRKGTDHELNEVARYIIQGVLFRYS
ncbi:MAG TPA: hypothetical protein DCX89_05230 [Saprospirales bacterium]|nr:hypothetical protein [Saprospirales bacterium]